MSATPTLTLALALEVELAVAPEERERDAGPESADPRVTAPDVDVVLSKRGRSFGAKYGSGIGDKLADSMPLVIVPIAM